LDITVYELDLIMLVTLENKLTKIVIVRNGHLANALCADLE
jgi:hypothetical protein